MFDKRSINVFVKQTFGGYRYVTGHLVNGRLVTARFFNWTFVGVVRYILYAPEYNVIFMSYILLCI